MSNDATPIRELMIEEPIRVVDEIFTAGDTRAGIQTIAFNLPNDERVREAKGSKKVLLHNVMRAKYDHILEPIAERVLAADELPHLAFEAYFNSVLHHELSHGLGPGTITVDDLPAAAASAVYLANGEKADFVQERAALKITLPAKPLNEYDTVVKVGFTKSIGEQ